MKSKEYWEKRFLSIEKSSNDYGMSTYKKVEPTFDYAQRHIEREIELWISRIAKNNEVSYTQARRMLDAKELAEFKWDVKEYIKYGQQNALDGRWMKQLENASAKFHISRLEALKIRVQQEVERAFGNELDAIDKMVTDLYGNHYYKSVYEIQKGFNTGFEVANIDQRKLDILKVKPWVSDGKNFSDRVWQSKRSMVSELHSELVRSTLLGKSPDELIRRMTKFIDKKFKNAKVQAGRLIMTEQAYFSSVAQKQCYKDLDVEKFEILATLDTRTSEICQNLDGEVFDMDDYEVGVTAPPFHVWCRSTTVPFFDDDVGQRIARGKDGKTYYVPDDMTYHEWKKKFVDSDEPFYDNTNRWKKVSPSRAKAVSSLNEYEHNGIIYKVDGIHIVIEPNSREIEVASILAENYGKKVRFVPKINVPQNINTPDYLINGVGWDLKTIEGSGKNTVYDAIKKGKKQANDFIVDLDVKKTKLSLHDVEVQVSRVFKSTHTTNVDEIVILINDEIVKAYKRK